MSRTTKITASLPGQQQKQNLYPTYERNNTVDIDSCPQQQRENPREVDQWYEKANNGCLQKQQVQQQPIAPPPPVVMENTHPLERQHIHDESKNIFFCMNFLL